MEDEKPLSEAIRKKMEVSGCDVVVARTVEQALDYLKEIGKIDAIWLDHYLLGKKNGLDFVTVLKKTKSKWRNIPIFVVSNIVSSDKVQSYIKLGVNKYYIKSDHKLENIVKDIKSAIEINN